LERALLSANRAGDQLVVTKLDRLGRPLDHLITLSRRPQARGVDLVVLDQGIDTSTPTGRLTFHLLGAFDVISSSSPACGCDQRGRVEDGVFDTAA
jgi:DNA invertase Pin-like site-specific DNA recombinase